MIDFKNIKIVKKFTYEGFDYYLLDRSELEFSEVQKKAGKDMEKLMILMWKLTVCDSDGELCNHTKDDIVNIPTSLRHDMARAIQSLLTGEKKS